MIESKIEKSKVYFSDYTFEMFTDRQKSNTPTFSGVTFSGGGVDRGVVVPSSPAGAYLNYDIYELGLRDGNDFAIEMEVRGEDLKRNTGYYYLFGMSDHGYTSSPTQNSLGFGLKNGVFGVNSGTMPIFTSLAGSTYNQVLNSIGDNAFVRVRIAFSPIQNTVTVFIDNKFIDSKIISGYSPNYYSMISYLNIGGTNAFQRKGRLKNLIIYLKQGY